MRQIFAALNHCHRLGICHRDLKLENILLSSSGAVKLIDFGMAYEYPRNPLTGDIDLSELLSGACGSRAYAAPEVLAGRGYNGFAADMWSCGVIMFGILFSFFPVTEATHADWRFAKLVRAQLAGHASVQSIFSWYKRRLHTVSILALDLVDSLLQTDARIRARVVEACWHPWLTGSQDSGSPSGRSGRKTTEGPADPAQPRLLIRRAKVEELKKAATM
jgi:serine/threonine protein kinase